MTSWLWGLLTLLVILGWLRVRSRLARRRGRGGETSLDDADLRRIEREGRLSLGPEDEEALDVDEARDEERRFWEEGWDEPEPW